MEFRFKNDTKPIDMWLLSMSHTYHSMVGVCNMIFTGAVIAATVKLWGRLNDFLELLFVLGCLLFTVIQPTLVYLRARAQVAGIPKDMELLFDEKGLHVTVGEQKESIPWEKITGITKERNMLIIRSDARHGYMLTNRAMGRQKKAFLDFLEQKMK